MSDNTKYNGWANRETWLVNLWFGEYFSDTDEGGNPITPDYIREFVEDQIAMAEEYPIGGFIADLLNSFDINYHELAAAYAPDEKEGQAQ